MAGNVYKKDAKINEVKPPYWLYRVHSQVAGASSTEALQELCMAAREHAFVRWMRCDHLHGTPPPATPSAIFSL